MTEESNAPPPHTRLGAAGTRLISEEAVYGLVLVAGMIVIISEVPGVDVFLLAVVGWLMAAAHTRHVGGLIAGALATALLGGVLIALKLLIHL